MTYTQAPLTWHLPDPERQPEFYRDVATKRFVAFWIDTAAILLLTLIAVVLTAFTGLFFFPLLFLAVGFAYRSYGLARHSATLGMRLTAIEFRDRNGDRLGTDTALLHTLGFSLSCLLPIIQITSMGFMLLNPRGQGLTDIALSTVALNRRAAS